MIRYLHHCIEQLDLAAEQIGKNQPAYSRFALILTDNVAELVLHRFAKEETTRDQLWWHLDKPKYTEEERKAVLGQHFDEKVKFAVRMSVLGSDERAFILICHRYRNELYHKGLIHERVIGDIAWHYHDVVCDLMVKARNGMCWWSSLDSISDVVRKYCGEDGLRWDVDEELPRVSQLLRSAKPARDMSLGTALSVSADERLEQLDNAIEFLVSDSPVKQTRKDVIFEVQAWPFLFSEEAKDVLRLSPKKPVKGLDEGMQVLREFWRPPIVRDPLPRWRRRAALLRSEASPLKALEKYQGLMDEMDYFDEKAHDAATALDEHIQHQIDVMRGK